MKDLIFRECFPCESKFIFKHSQFNPPHQQWRVSNPYLLCMASGTLHLIVTKMVITFTPRSSFHCSLQNTSFFSNRQDCILRKLLYAASERFFFLCYGVLCVKAAIKILPPFCHVPGVSGDYPKSLKIISGLIISDTIFLVFTIWDLNHRCWILKYYLISKTGKRIEGVFDFALFFKMNTP